MKRLLLRLQTVSILTALIVVIAAGQEHYHSQKQEPVAKYRTVDLAATQEEPAYIEFVAYPNPGGQAYHKFLERQKAKAAEFFPRQQDTVPANRSEVEPPELLNDFLGNGFTAGIPLDNHLAVNRNDQIVSVVNTHMLVVGPTGVWEETYSLDNFWSETGETERYFDPRIIYDPQEDRFTMAMMQDGECAGSNIVFAFSASNDPTGVWHVYQFDGCPKLDSTFADFPMIAITDDELFFTYNAVYQDSTWQTGFNETLIYQINKHNGYGGEDLQWRSWENISFDGIKLRYIHPVKYATENLGPEMYFLSNRSFDISNDSVFLVHINSTQDDPEVRLTIEVMIADQHYGVPPTAEQPTDFLQTNDARVLDGFYSEGEIQFVSNTMDPATGRCAVYHGIIRNITINPLLTGKILSNESEHFAYPGIAYTGLFPGDREAIIIASHASPDRFPGYSALYYNDGHSDWVTVKEGLRVIDMIKVDNPFGLDPTLERWGDYSGIQPHYGQAGTVYTVSSYGKPGKLNDSWIGYLARPTVETSITEHSAKKDPVSAFPNPAYSEITFELTIPARDKLLAADIYSADGRHIAQVYNSRVNYQGLIRFHMATDILPAGTYFARITLDQKLLSSKKFSVR